MCVIDAVLDAGFGLTTVALMVSVCVAPLASVPIDHWPVTVLYAPWVVVADTKLSCGGRSSLAATAVAVLGPSLVTEPVTTIV